MFKKLVVIVTLALTISSAAVVSAQETDVPPEGFERCATLEDRLSAIADQLDITLEDVQNAYEPGMSIAELADALSIDLSEIERSFPECPPNGERLAEKAELLGITMEELTAELQSGKTLYQIAVEQGVNPAEISRIYSEEALTRAAEALGITVEELTDSLADGQTVRELAEELGVELPRLHPAERGFRRNGRPGDANPPDVDDLPDDSDRPVFPGGPRGDGPPSGANNNG